MKNKEQIISFLGVLILAIILPGILRATNSAVRYMAGAEGRLASLNIEVDRVDTDLTNRMRSTPTFVRIDRIFETSVANTGQNGQLTFDWTNADRQITEMTESKKIPLVVMDGFSDDAWNTNQWQQAAQATILHFSRDLGVDNVHYELPFSQNFEDNYLSLVRAAQTVTGVKGFKIGGAAFENFDKKQIEKFADFVRQKGLRIDFISWFAREGDLSEIVKRIDVMTEMRKTYPELAGAETVIDLADDITSNAFTIVTLRELETKPGLISIARTRVTPEVIDNQNTERLRITGEGSWIRAFATRLDGKYQLLAANYDEKGLHTELVPVTFLNLSSQGGVYTLTTTVSGGSKITEEVATSAAVIQKYIPMPADSVVFMELEQKGVPEPTLP